MRELLGRKYKLYNITLIPGATLHEQYNYIIRLVYDAETLRTYDIQSYFDIVDKARQLQNNRFTRIIYRLIFESWYKLFNLHPKYIPESGCL